MRIEIVTIGNEVLSGRTLDTNFVFLARGLEEASVVVAYHSTVGDTAEGIGDALKLALSRADGVIMTGGLGPTPDDMTRKAVATALNRPLQLDESVLAHIRERGPRKSFERLDHRPDAERGGADPGGGHEGGDGDDGETDRRHDADPGWQHHETSAGLGRAVNGVTNARASAAMTLSSTVTSIAPGEPRTRSNPAASATAVAP